MRRAALRALSDAKAANQAAYLQAQAAHAAKISELQNAITVGQGVAENGFLRMCPCCWHSLLLLVASYLPFTKAMGFCGWACPCAGAPHQHDAAAHRHAEAGTRGYDGGGWEAAVFCYPGPRVTPSDRQGQQVQLALAHRKPHCPTVPWGGLPAQVRRETLQKAFASTLARGNSGVNVSAGGGGSGLASAEASNASVGGGGGGGGVGDIRRLLELEQQIEDLQREVLDMQVRPC